MVFCQIEAHCKKPSFSSFLKSKQNATKCPKFANSLLATEIKYVHYSLAIIRENWPSQFPNDADRMPHKERFLVCSSAARTFFQVRISQQHILAQTSFYVYQSRISFKGM